MSLEKTIKEVREYIEKERNFLETKDGNYFAFLVGEVVKYINYLEFIRPRYLRLSHICIKIFRERQEQMMKTAPGSHIMTAQEVQDMFRSKVLQTKLHLEIESIFLFCNVLLDRIAAVTSYYFGPGKKQWNSFDAMQQHLVSYCKNKKLTVPNDLMMNSMVWLFKNVAVFRHEQLAHKHTKDYNTRLIHGTGWNTEDREAFLSLGLLYPRDNESAPEVVIKPSLIYKNMEIFVREWIKFLESNRNRRNLSPRK